MGCTVCPIMEHKIKWGRDNLSKISIIYYKIHKRVIYWDKEKELTVIKTILSVSQKKVVHAANYYQENFESFLSLDLQELLPHPYKYVSSL